MKWFTIVSSHAFSGTVSRANAPRGLCGRWGKPGAELVDDMPDGKSCESCLRIVAKRADA